MRISANITKRNAAHTTMNLFVNAQMIGTITIGTTEEIEFLHKIHAIRITDLTKGE